MRARASCRLDPPRDRPDAGPCRLDPAGTAAPPAFGCKNHVAIDRRHGLIRGWTASRAAARDGTRLAEVIGADNTAADVWADTAYRSAKNEVWLAARGLVSRIHRKEPPGRPMAARTRQPQRTPVSRSAEVLEVPSFNRAGCAKAR